MKGTYDCECNRTACSNSHAVYFNKSTEKYYCESCAHTINMHNRMDCIRLFGCEDLCEREDIEEVEEVIDEKFAFEHIDPYVLDNPYSLRDYLPHAKPLKRGHYAPIRTEDKVPRNSLCSCGSGKKYKKCCIN